MRASKYLLPTLKETPADAEIVSHQLMLRAGMIRRLAAGIYTWLPLGLRVLRKVETIVREEMDRSGAHELLMPAVQPAELWQESGRWEEYGPELLRIRDRHERDFCFGPTHEEVITDLARHEIRSYRQLPVCLYQIQWKFRDEIRPRFGVMRAREFLMKDAYSFHLSQASLQETYDIMHDAYSRVFVRSGLEFRAVRAPSGPMGGTYSHEFHVLAESGEDAIAFSTESDFAANVELVPAAPPAGERPPPAASMETVDTPGRHTIDALSRYLGVPASRCLKTLLVAGRDGGLVALALRGDHELNTHKAQALAQVAEPLRFATEAEVRELTGGAGPGSIGPVGLRIPVVADHDAAHMADFVCGANTDDQHLVGVNWGRNLPEPETADLRNVVVGDPSPDGRGTLSIARGIEVGHIFQLGDKYSRSMDAVVLDESGNGVAMPMGCYGIGVSRVVAAAIEQNHDEHGIIWPTAIAPFQVALLPMNMHKSRRLREAADALYAELVEAGLEVLFDDRHVRPGVMFAESDLIGTPHRVVLSERGLDAGQAEYKARHERESQDIPLDQVARRIAERVKAELEPGA